MTNAQLERRLLTLERQVAELQSRVGGPATKDIRRLIGIFDDDEGMGEILAEAQEFRKQTRQKAHRATRKRRSRAKA